MYSKHLPKIDEEVSTVDKDKCITNSIEDGPSCLSTDKPITLTDILQDKTELEYFKTFLSKQFAIQDLSFYTEIENFFISEKSKDLKARLIRKKFFNQQYFLGPQSPATKEQQLQIFTAEGTAQGQRIPRRPSTAIIREAQKHVRDRLENKWLPMYMETSEFKQRHLAVKFDNDKKKSGDLMNSQESVFLHQLREDYVTRDKFIEFLAIQEDPGQFLVNDFNFWLENERFKEMYRNDVMINMLEKKMQAIITHYLLSPVPPKLQLDIPQGIADKITKREQLNQHIFREAQVSVLANLFSYCTSFQRLSDSHGNNSLPFKKLEEEAEKRRDSFLKREYAHHAYKQPVISKRNKRQTEKQKKTDTNTTRVAIAFRLSEINPQYEILSACEDASVDSPYVLKPSISNIKIERAAPTICKSGTEVVSLPSIPFAAKQDKGSSKDTSKRHTTAKR